MVEALAPLAGGADEDAQVVDDAALADVLVELAGAQRLLELQLVGVRSAGEQARVVGHVRILASRGDSARSARLGTPAGRYSRASRLSESRSSSGTVAPAAARRASVRARSASGRR